MLAQKRKISTMDEKDDENVVQGWGNPDIYDILVRIFENFLSLEEITSGVAHVSSGWRGACCDPILWSTLDLTRLSATFISIPPAEENDSDGEDDGIDDNLTRFLKISMSLSKKNTKTLIVPFSLNLSDEMLRYTTKRCPNLKHLVVPSWNVSSWRGLTLEVPGITETGLCNAMQSCKKLETLTMPSMHNPHDIFLSVRENCKKFRELKVMGRIQLFFVQNLIQLLPRLKVLSLRCTAIDKDALIKILEKMKHLEVLNISHSYFLVAEEGGKLKTVIVRELDEKIMEKASKLKKFVTCMEHMTCLKCQRTVRVQGTELSCEYDGQELWKEDEINSLRL